MATRAELDAFFAQAIQRERAAEEARRAAEAEEAARLAAEYERTRGRTGGEVLQDVGAQLGQSVLGLGQSLYGVANLSSGGVADRIFGLSDNFQQSQEILGGMRSSPTQIRAAEAGRIFADEGVLPGVANYATDPLLLQDLVVSNLLSIAPSALASRAAAGATARAVTAPGSRITGDAATRLIADRATTAGIRTGAAQTAGSVNVDAINRATEAGATPGEAQLAGLGAGVIAGVAAPLISRATGAGALEAAVASRIFGGPGGSAVGGNIVRGAVTGAAREGVEEGLQSGTEQVATNLFAPGVDVTEGVGQAAALGTLAGGILGGPLGGYAAQGVRRETPLRAAIETQVQELAQLNGTELQRPLVRQETVPDEVRELVEAQAITPATGISETDLLTAQDVRAQNDEQVIRSVASFIFDVDQTPDGQVQYRQFNPDLQRMEVIPETVALQAANEAILAAEQQNVPGGLPEVEEVETIEGAPAPDSDVLAPLPDVEEIPVEEVTATAVATAPARARAPLVAPSQLQEFINQRVGVGSGLGQADLATAEDLAINSLFSVSRDEATGQVTYSRYNSDLQRMEDVSPAVARREAKRLVSQEQATVREAERQASLPPTTGWKQRLSKELGLTPNALRGKEWDAFSAAVEQAGVRANDAGADSFLRQVAQQLGQDNAGAGLFAARLAEKYDSAPVGANQDASAAVEQASANATQEEAPKAEADARERVITAESAPAQVVAPGATYGDVVPSDVTATDRGASEGVARASARVQRIARRMVAEDSTLTPERATYQALEDIMYDASGATELDELFSVMKAMPEFRTLSSEDQTTLTSVFSDLYDEMESVGRFRRSSGDKGKALPVAEFNRLVSQARNFSGRQVTVEGYQTVREYRRTTGRQAPNDAQGVFTDDGIIHVIRENIRNKQEFALVLAHERGHEGLRSLLGDRLAPAVNRLYANAAIRKRLEAKQRQLPGINRLTAGEEVLADMLAQGEKFTGDVWSKLKAGVSQFLASALGFGDVRVSDNDVDELLTSTAAYIRGREVNKAPRLADSLRNVQLDKVVGDPASLLESAVYSRAVADLERLVETLPTDQGSPTTLLSHITSRGMDVARNGVTAMRGTGSTKVFRNVLHAVPLAQIDNLYSKLFDNETGTNNLTGLVRETRRREARYNQLLTRAKDVTYGNEKFKVSSLDLAKKWEKLGRDDKAAFDALNALQQYATLYSIWPDKSWADQNAVDYQALGYSEAERRQAYNSIRKLWGRAGSTGQEIFKQAQGDYRAQWIERYNALANELSRTTGIPRVNPDGTKNPEFQRKYGETLDASLNRIRSGPYSPLTRYGDYFTVVRDADGNVLEFHGSDTLADAQRKASNIRSGIPEGSNDIYVTTSVRDEFLQQLDGINHGLLSRFEQSVRDSVPEGTDTEVVNGLITGLREAYLQSLPRHSLMQHANQRKGVQGFTLDAFRAYNDYTLKAAKATADYDHNGNISRHILGMAEQVRAAGRVAQDANTTTMGQILQAVRAQRAAYLRAEQSPVADWVGQAGFIQFMTSPSQMIINAMQTPMVAIPRLAARFSSSGAIREAKNGLVAFIKSKGDLLGDKSVVEPEMKRVLTRLQENGVLDFTLAHDIAGLADGGFSRLSGHWRGVMETLSFAMHRSEVFNRQVTAYAAAKLAADKVRADAGIAPNSPLPDELIERVALEAEQSVYDSHYDYSQSNKPTLMQGPYRRLLFQFQQYRVNALAMMYKDFRDSLFTKGLTKAEVESARRGLAWLLGMQLAFTGAAGTVMAPLVFFVLDMFRDDEDLLDSRTEFVRSAPQWLAHGALAGVLDTGRLDSGSLLPYFGDRAYAPKDATTKETVMYHLSRNLGPWVGLASAWTEFASKTAEGKPIEAMEAGLPKPFSDAIKALSGINGVEDARGVSYFDQDIWSGVAQAAGLRSGARREVEEVRGASYQLAKRVSTVKSRYMARVVLGLSTGDNEMVQEAYADIARWNQTYPDMAIGADDVRSAVVSKYRGQVLTDLYGVPTGRPLTPSALEALNL